MDLDPSHQTFPKAIKNDKPLQIKGETHFNQISYRST